MISTAAAERYHNKLIEVFGGSKGIRDIAGLEAALARPYMTFDQQDLYPTPSDKAAAIFQSVIISHPFIDGNKRVAYALMRATLLLEGCDFIASQDEKYDIAIAASMGNVDFDQIRDWITSRLIKNTE
jgi:death-on-curing protein